jgi:hypothetical protein
MLFDVPTISHCIHFVPNKEELRGMTTLSPISARQASDDRAGTTANESGAMSTIVQRQLAVLEALAAEGHAEAAALQTEVADLTTRLSTATARIARLEASLSNHARLLAAIREGLDETFAQAAAVSERQTPARVVSNAPASFAAAPEQPPAPRIATPPVAPAAEARPSLGASRPSFERAPEPRSAPPQPPVEPEAPRFSAPAARQYAPAPAFEQPAEPQPVASSFYSAAVRQAVIEQPIETEPEYDDGRPRVQRGSTVEVAFDDDTTEEYTIVRPSEANPIRNLIGDNSPLGMALLGAAVGDARTYRVRPTSPDITVYVRSIS